MPNMKRLLSIALAALAFGAQAQTREPLGESAKAMIGTWEFSNAERDKTCSVTFKNERSAAGFALTFDANCANLFPLVRQIAGWKYPEDDLLYFLDAQGKSVAEFNEVEDGIFEAPTPGVGVLFLQAPGAAGAVESKPEQVVGTWVIKRGEGASLCTLTLANTPTSAGFALTVQPGCDPAIAKLGFGQWRLDGGQLVLLPSAGGEGWSLEEIDDRTWRLLPDKPNQLTLVRQ
jgi:hypothetical protein